MKKAEFELKVQEGLAEAGFELNKKESGLVADTVFQVVLDTLVSGEKVPLGVLGSISTSERAARKGRNPSTGEEIDIASSIVAKYKPSKAVKESLNNK